MSASTAKVLTQVAGQWVQVERAVVEQQPKPVRKLSDREAANRAARSVKRWLATPYLPMAPRINEAAQHARQIDQRNELHRDELLQGVPWGVRAYALAQFETIQAEQGVTPALKWLRDYVGPLMESVREHRVPRNIARIEGRDQLHEYSSDASVKHWARRRAAEAQMHVERAGVDCWMDRYAAAREFVSRWGIEPIELPCDAARARPELIPPAVLRMTCPKWWRLRARRMLDLRIEAEQIAAGKVRRGVSAYVSRRNLERGRDQQQRNEQLLLNLQATNELGQSFSLAELAEKGVSNPHIRQSELMVRLKGCEALADRLGWVGLFLTWTLPSRFHRWLSKGNTGNPRWADGGNPLPRDGQAALRDLWAKCRASLAKLHIRYFGIRVAEPHHDGCPHWHLLLFVQPEHRKQLIEFCRRYALADSPDEKGAEKHRFKVEVIDKEKGGATSYVAKYVAKMTTGKGLMEATERGEDGKRRKVGRASAAAERARRWASVHRIRQFQFVGLPAIGIWRECRRMKETPTETAQGMPIAGMTWARIERARAAADISDYAQHVLAIGGAAVPRREQKLMVAREAVEGVNAYGEPLPPRVVGVAPRVCFVNVRERVGWIARRSRRRKNGSVAITRRKGVIERRDVITLQGVSAVTRLHEWVVSFKSDKGPGQGAAVADSAPWTRVNNCNRTADAGDAETVPRDLASPEMSLLDGIDNFGDGVPPPPTSPMRDRQ